MDQALKKLHKKVGKAPSDLEKQVATELLNIQNASQDELKAELEKFQIRSAREIEGEKGGKKVLLISVQWKNRLLVPKLQQKLVRELEKKFSDKHVVIVVERKSIRKSVAALNKIQRKHSQTKAGVHQALLEDVIYPTEIVGKRTRVSNGKKTVKIFLNPNDRVNIESKLASFEAAYAALTNNAVKFEFPLEN